MELLKEIKTRIEKEDRPSQYLYAETKAIALQMYMTNKMSKENIVMMCADLIKLYENLKEA